MMLPERIGHYEVREIVGQGGMAVVYRAYDSRHRRDVAIKVMMQQHLHNDRLRIRFNREAQTILDLTYPTIVPLFDYGEFGPDHLPFLVMGYMPRGSLKERIARGPLPINEVVKVVQRIGLALDYAHSRNVIHRDIKPGNILFDQYDHPYLADFGIALSGQAGQTVLTGDNLAVGTPYYMSPEQGQGQSVDARTDIYSLGVVLFEMLTGKRPYASDTPVTPLAVMLMHVQNPIPDVLALNPRLPAGYSAVIRRAMAKDREDRYNSASQLVTALKSATRGAGVTTPPDGSRVAPTPNVDTGERRPPPAEKTPDAPLPTVVARTDDSGERETAAVPVTAEKKSRPLWLLGLVGVALILLLALCGGGAWWASGNLLAEEPTPSPPSSTATPQPVVAATDVPATARAVAPTRAVGDGPAPPAPPGQAADPVLIPTLRPTNTPAGPGATAEPLTTFLLRIYRCDAPPAVFTRESRITFEWEWAGELEPGQYLEVRVGPAGDPNLSIVGGRVEPTLRDGAIWRWPINAADFVRANVVDYEWQVFLMEPGPEEIDSSARGCFQLTP